MNYDSGSHEDGITPETLQDLPLVFNSGPRSSATFVLLMPGVSSGGSANAFDARINGGLQSGDEAVLDGASMQQGFMSQSGMVSIFNDFPYSPDMVSEIKVVSSSYDAQYGSTTGGQIVAVTKSGQEKFHGAAFEYAQRDGLNANQWGATEKSPLNRNNYGGALGGPMKIPGLWSNSVKTYFYADVEGYRQTGGATRNTLSIPSLKERSGDFSDWRDASGNLIPIYDPASARLVNGVLVKDPFPGNIIPANRITDVAKGYLQYLPTPTNDGTLNNYLVPTAIPDSILGDSNYFFGRFDTYIGQNDHVAVSLWFQRAKVKYYSELPHELATETTSDPQNASVHRFNWDHTFGSNLLNHLTFGYLNRNEGYGCVNRDAVDSLPKIEGVVANKLPSQMTFSDGFATYGCNGSLEADSITTRPTYVLNDLVTFIKGSHTIKIGGEYRNIGGNVHSATNEQGTFNFGRGATGIDGVISGNPIASFLLGEVDNANMEVRTASTQYPRQHAWIVHVGDTWNATSKLTLNYGLRWDYYSPSTEKYDRLAFFDPNGVNPSAGGRLGSLAYAGTGWGEASYGARYPEKNWYGGWAPRLGATYALNSKTLIRAGWGLFYDRAYYPGWGAGMAQDGFNSNVSFGSSLNGTQAAFNIEDGFPQDYTPPPFISSDFRNGSSLTYRPLDGNERARAQQWNLTIDREISPGFTLGLAYVGSHGSRAPSQNDPLNAINPSYLSLGERLNDEFQPGMASLDGVPLPYEGWVEQMTSCAPTVAQALRPYPQYCRQPAGPQRVPRHLRLPLAAGQAREALLARHVRPRVLHVRPDVHERHRQRAGRRHHVERRERFDLAVRAGPQPLARGRRRDSHPVCRPRVGPPDGEGQEVGELGRVDERDPRRVAALDGLPGLLRDPVLLPFELLQRSRPVPVRLHPVDERRHLRAELRQPRRFEAALQPERVRVTGCVQLLLRPGPAHQQLPQVRLSQPGPLAHQEHEALQGREPAAASRGVQRLELAQLERLVDHVGRHRLQHRCRQRRLRDVERRRHGPARRPARGAHRVLTP